MSLKCHACTKNFKSQQALSYHIKNNVCKKYINLTLKKLLVNYEYFVHTIYTTV